MLDMKDFKNQKRLAKLLSKWKSDEEEVKKAVLFAHMAIQEGLEDWDEIGELVGGAMTKDEDDEDDEDDDKRHAFVSDGLGDLYCLK